MERRQQLLMRTSNTAALEALVPSELEQHLAMNRARLITCEQVRSEIQAYIEARRSQFAFKTVSTKSTSHPMKVDSFGKGGKKGKRGKKGKGDGKRGKKEGQHQNQNPNPSKDIVCWHCGKHGMLIESKEFIWLRRNSKQRRPRKTEERQAKEQARWNRENKLQWWNHSRSQLLRALQTWRRLKPLSDHRTQITKVG